MLFVTTCLLAFNQQLAKQYGWDCDVFFEKPLNFTYNDLMYSKGMHKDDKDNFSQRFCNFGPERWHSNRHLYIVLFLSRFDMHALPGICVIYCYHLVSQTTPTNSNLVEEQLEFVSCYSSTADLRKYVDRRCCSYTV